MLQSELRDAVSSKFRTKLDPITLKETAFEAVVAASMAAAWATEPI